ALKFDPAVCSTPLVMTLVDVSGLIIYMLIAGAILGFTLG
ncbi:MAG: Mg/Co/Ni transporter MgtE, partial [Candidatus Binatia bacterium]